MERHNARRSRRRRYNPARGGHAPGFLRDPFCEWIGDGAKETTVEVDEERRPLRWLVGQLWNCTDILPGTECEDLDIPRGSTYAQAVRGTTVQSVVAGTLR